MLQRLVVAGALLCAADGYRVSPRSSSLVQYHASKREDGGRSAAQVFVRNVPFAANPQSLRTAMEDAFGPVADVWLPASATVANKTRGYGKVTFGDSASRRTALEAGTLRVIGRNLQIIEATPKSAASGRGGRTGRGALVQQLRTSRRRQEIETLVGQLGELSVKEASMAISAWGRVRDWRRALELLSEMRERGLAPDVITYSAAISACEKSSQWERALELLSEMRERGLASNVITYSAAISACEKGSQWERALELLSEMRDRGLAPNVITYNAVIEACQNAGAEAVARLMYRESLDSRLQSQSKRSMVDLHDMSVAVAKSAVAVVFEDILSGRRDCCGSDLVIITGRGNRSEGGDALLKPAILDMLLQPEYAELSAKIDPNNNGLIRVVAARLLTWAGGSSSSSS